MWCGPAIAGAYARLCSDVPSSRNTSHIPDLSCMHACMPEIWEGAEIKTLHALGLSLTSFRPHVRTYASCQDVSAPLFGFKRILHAIAANMKHSFNLKGPFTSLAMQCSTRMLL